MKHFPSLPEHFYENLNFSYDKQRYLNQQFGKCTTQLKIHFQQLLPVDGNEFKSFVQLYIRFINVYA